MTQLERFDDLERSGFPVPPELGSIIRKVQAERDATLGNRDLTQEARQRLDRELVAGGVELVKPAEAAVIERELKTFDREEGDARASQTRLVGVVRGSRN